MNSECDFCGKIGCTKANHPDELCQEYGFKDVDELSYYSGESRSEVLRLLQAANWQLESIVTFAWFKRAAQRLSNQSRRSDNESDKGESV
jgi:hypothetical protein